MRAPLGLAVAFAVVFTALSAFADCVPPFLLKWGTQGSGNLQFQYPMDVAVDASGYVYVADMGNNRVLKYTSSGSYVAQWGTSGTGNSQFNWPRGVAVDASGYVYVTDSYNYRVQKFTTAGAYVTQWGASGTGNGQFNQPWGIAVDASGYVYVADLGNNRIQKFTNTGAYVTQWGTSGSGNGQFSAPRAVAVGGSPIRVYVADTNNNRVQKFSTAGEYVLQWSTGVGGGTLQQPEGVEVDGGGSVYVVEAGNRVQRFTNSGGYISSWGSTGSGDGQFNLPEGVVTDASGNVYVADTYNHRIQKFGAVPSSIALTTSQNPSVYGQSVTLTATASLPVSTWGVYFYNGSTVIGSGGWSSGVVNLPLANLPVGTDSLTAVYSGSGGCSGPSSPVLLQTVNQASTTTALDVNLNPSGIGQSVGFTATVSVVAPGGGTPTGTVQFSVDGLPIGGPAPLNTGVANLSLAFWSAGSRNIVATYSGDGNYSGSASSPLTQTVVAAQVPPSYVTKWGAWGAGNGQFEGLSSVATDPSGNVYVVDQYNNRVQKFTGSGAYLTQWGTPGAGNGQFSYPGGVAVDGAGNVYVADQSNNRIQKFTGSGVYLTQWGGAGSGNGQFSDPFGIAVGDSGDVYVADILNNRIQRFTSAGAYLSQWGTAGSGNGQFNEPLGVAVDASGAVFVADLANQRIQKFTSTGTYLGQWGSAGSDNGRFSSPYGIAVDGSGCVYVAEMNGRRVQKFTGTGAYLTQWGSFGSGDGQFVGAIGVAVDGTGNVYVVDYSNDRVQKFQLLQQITSVKDVPNDQGRQVRVRFTANGADNAVASLPVTGYEVYRRIALSSPAAASSRLAATPRSSMRRGIASPSGVMVEGWDYVLSVPAHADTSYYVVVPTLADSNYAGLTWSVFMVRAATATPSIYYDSAPDSGYSVDNLPPAVPAPFTAAYASGATHLHWGANAEPDLWSYKVYRGGSAGFVPGPSNLIATRSDTGYVDPGPAGSYYKLSALDLNGNESGYALVTPGGTTDVPAGPPLAFALEGARPNPTAGRELAVQFVLPSAAPAQLELLDVSGRRVITREVGALGAGRHVVDLAADRRLAPGLYLVRLTQGANLRVARVAVLK